MVISTNEEVFAYIAIGTNQGNLLSNINEGIRELNSGPGEVVDSAFLYQSLPMYYTDQPLFLNTMVKIKTKLSPSDLLNELKRIERKLGRVVNFQNGPRVIDLDITLYGNNGEVIFKIEEDNYEKKLPLYIPHKLFHERNFVLYPLLDLLPETWKHPILGMPLSELVSALNAEDRASLTRVIPFSNPNAWHPPIFLPIKKSQQDKQIRPIIMGILNVTPDSFSDGGKYMEISSAIKQVESMIKEGAIIIDIGGESSRPNAESVGEEEELNRVLPIIKEISKRRLNCLISVDTKKSSVARTCLENGADLINDITAGGFDSKMKEVIVDFQVPYILMHSRGNSSTMMFQKNYDNIIDNITSELSESIQNIQVRDQFIPKWLQIVDPGIGFAKGYEENLKVLTPENLKILKRNFSDRPMLIGLSRKKFISTIIENEKKYQKDLSSSLFNSKSQQEDIEKEDVTMKQRDLVSTSAVCVSLLGGADILRVHDVETTSLICSSFSQFL